MEETTSTVVQQQSSNWLLTYYGSYYVNYAMVLWFLGGALAIGVIAIVLAKFIAPSDPTPAKRSTYECSEQPLGPAWIRFNIRYYYFAILFLVFDVEVVFFFPWAVVFHSLKTQYISVFQTILTLGFPIFGEMLVFLFLVLLGYFYAWRKGYLTWD